MRVFFAFFLLLFYAGMIVLYGFLADYVNEAFGNDYSRFMDIHLITFLGFGYLMTFLSHNNFTAISHSLVASCVTVLWFILNSEFWRRVVDGRGKSAWSTLLLSTDVLVRADFCCISMLIAFGVLLGRLTSEQLVVMAILQTMFYALNDAIATVVLKVPDKGGSTLVHLFGALFGLACAKVLDSEAKRAEKIERDRPLERSTNTTDTFSFFGSALLFCFWPSCNSYFWSDKNLPGSKDNRAVINTILAITSSGLMSFYASTIIRWGKFRMREIQLGMVTGGIAVSSIAPYWIAPWAPMVIGTVTAPLVLIAIRLFRRPLRTSYGIFDTATVFAMHGIPGFIGSLASIIAVGSTKRSTYTDGSFDLIFPIFSTRGPGISAAYQVAMVAITIALSILGGCITGFILRFLNSLAFFYTDEVEWLVDVEDSGIALFGSEPAYLNNNSTQQPPETDPLYPPMPSGMSGGQTSSEDMSGHSTASASTTPSDNDNRRNSSNDSS